MDLWIWIQARTRRMIMKVKKAGSFFIIMKCTGYKMIGCEFFIHFTVSSALYVLPSEKCFNRIQTESFKMQ
jgi:hypothetical protein